MTKKGTSSSLVGVCVLLGRPQNASNRRQSMKDERHARKKRNKVNVINNNNN
jgi:hypothetical protein